ncbi:MAG: ATP-binding cassette domain-containing protein [Pseudomonadota bacterium]
METEKAKIEISGVVKRFGDQIALQGIDLGIAAGKKTVIVGPAASGKTVLMKCIAGIVAPEEGSVAIDGTEVAASGSDAHAALMRSVGVLFQQGGLFDSLPVWRNIAFKLLSTEGMSEKDARALAVEKLAMVNLRPETADLVPAELSGGMQKRVGIARALAGDPSLLLLDEPTAGLDPITTTAINALIETSRRDIGATVLSITSDMTSARTAYDRLVMLHEGRIVWQGDTDAIDAEGNEFIEQLIGGRARGPIHIPLRRKSASA